MPEKFYENVFKDAPTGIVLLGDQGKLIEFNSRFCKLLGYSPEELTTMHYTDVVFKDDLPHHREKLHQLVNGEMDYLNSERRFVHKAGHVVHGLVSASVMHDLSNARKVIVQIQDITERRQAADLFRKAFETTPMAMSILILDSLRYIDVNEAFVKVTGYTREEVLGRSIVELGIVTAEQARAYLEELIAGGGRISSKGVNYQTKTGETRNSITSVDIIEMGSLQCALITTEDVTEKLIMESEFSRLDRLNVVGEMAATITHEIRNPITTVKGFLQLFKGKHSDQQQSYFDLMVEELDRANGIITQYLALSKQKSAQHKIGNINHVIKTLYPLIAATALETDCAVELELDEVVDLPLDDNEIRQMVINLARNGLEAMDPGGVLKITSYQDQNSVVLGIIDHGQGIPEELGTKIGTPFFTTKETGTGLGLAVCYRIAERHRATISFISDASGTTFEVRFAITK